MSLEKEELNRIEIGLQQSSLESDQLRRAKLNQIDKDGDSGAAREKFFRDNLKSGDRISVETFHESFFSGIFMGVDRLGNIVIDQGGNDIRHIGVDVIKLVWVGKSDHARWRFTRLSYEDEDK